MDYLLTLPFPNIDPVALRLGPLAIRWYGLAYLVGFVLAWLVMRWLLKRWGTGATVDDELTILLFAVGGVILGGRLGYVLFYDLAYYAAHPLTIFALWDGGMSFHGALIGVIVAGVIAARVVRIPFLTIADAAAVGTPIGLFFGRIANFINGELWGRPSNLPWAIVFPRAGPLPRHPSQLYEALLEGVVLLAILLILVFVRRRWPRGFLFGVMMTGYALARITAEFFRQPDIQIGFLPGGITMGQVLSVPVLVVGVALIAWSLRPGRPSDGVDEPRAQEQAEGEGEGDGSGGDA